MEVSGQLNAPAALPRRKSPGTHWRGGRVGPIAGRDAVEKWKTSYPCRESNPDRPVRSQSLYQPSYPGSFINQ
jgi:hypothetical protein